MSSFNTLPVTTDNTSTDEYLLRQGTSDFKQTRESLAASIANARWLNTANYETGSTAVGSDGIRYKAVQASGPANGGAVNPVTDTNGSRWEIDFTVDPSKVEVEPLNNQWNGFFDPKHQSQLPAPAGYPDAGGTSYLAGDEWSFGNFASGGSISSSDTGITFTVGVYKLFEYTSEQLANIDVDKVPVYLKDELGNEHFVTNATNGVNVTKPDATTLKVELTVDIFAELGITKVWRFFVTDKVGRVAELSPDETERMVRGGFVTDTIGQFYVEIYKGGRVVLYIDVIASEIQNSVVIPISLSTVQSVTVGAANGNAPLAGAATNAYISSGTLYYTAIRTDGLSGMNLSIVISGGVS